MKTKSSIYLLFLAMFISSWAFEFGWVGEDVVSSAIFTNDSSWTVNQKQIELGDSAWISFDSSTITLHWKFGKGFRSKFAQCYLTLNETIDLSSYDIFSIDFKGSTCNRNRHVELKFEDGTPPHPSKSWRGLAKIERWANRLTVPKTQFTDNGNFSWDKVKIISFAIAADSSENDTLVDSGKASFRFLKKGSTKTWIRGQDFDSLTYDASFDTIKQHVLDSILNRQDAGTGLFATWNVGESVSYLYGHGLVLKILSLEGEWENGTPKNKYAESADKLVDTLISYQDSIKGYWPRSWITSTGEILDTVEADGRVWLGDFPWIIVGLTQYVKETSDSMAKVSLIKAIAFLDSCMDGNSGKLSTWNAHTNSYMEETSFEAYAAVILAAEQAGLTAKAEKMLDYVIANGWDSEMKYFREGDGYSGIVLFVNTWLTPILKRHGESQKALDALSFVGKALNTQGSDGTWGLDGFGPLGVWYEGSLSYISAGGPGSQQLFNHIKPIVSDGGVPHYNDSLESDGIWMVKWSSLDGASWLYFVVSRTSPLPVKIPISKNQRNILQIRQFSQKLYVSYKGNNLGKVRFEIYNVKGILLSRIEQNMKQNTLTIDISEFPAGMYIVRIFDQQQTLLNKIVFTKN